MPAGEKRADKVEGNMSENTTRDKINISSFLQKKDSQALYGVAILLMVFHHLFCIPDRLSYGYISIFGNYDFGARFAYHGRLCVAIYAFISGYAASIASKKNPEMRAWPRFRNSVRYSAARMKKLYVKLWLVFAIFVPIGILFFGVKTSVIEVILALITGFSAINIEWWYFFEYLLFALIYPLFDLSLHHRNRRELFIKTAVLVLVAVILPFIACANMARSGINEIGLMALEMFISYIYIYMIGYFVEKWRLFDWLDSNLPSELKAITGVILTVLVFVIRWFMVPANPGESKPDIILAPFLVFGLTLILHSDIAERKVVTVLCLFGRYSTFMWLTHTFFIYYYFQPVILLPRVSILIFIWAVLISLVNAMIMEKIYEKIAGLKVPDKKG